MGAIRRRKEARNNLKKLAENPLNVLLIHYSYSKTFDDDYGGISPIITAIVIKSLNGQIDEQFAIHFEADKAGIPQDQIQDSYRELEMRILKHYNDFARRYTGCFWIHWDMKNIHFGFEAIKHRFEKIFGRPDGYYDIPSSQKRNLRLIIEDMYGEKFVVGPDHLKSLMLCNNKNVIDPRYISGDQESIEFERKNFDAVIQSVDTKVDFLKKATSKLIDKNLLVTSKNGFAIFDDVVHHPIFTALGWIIGFIGLVLTIYQIV